MSPRKRTTHAAVRYDHGLRNQRGRTLPPEVPQPQLSRFWPPENVEILQKYVDWRLQGGFSHISTLQHCLPMAGHVLGLNLKPHPELDLDRDLEKAMDFILAKQFSAAWNKVCRNALANFRRFLRQERGLPEYAVRRAFDTAPHVQGLPEWLVRELKNLQLLRQRHWRPARQVENAARFWSIHLNFWRFAVEKRGVVELPDLKRQHVFDFIDHRLGQGRSVTTVNMEVRSLCGFLLFLQEQGYSVPNALTRIPGLKQPQRLPKFLTDEQIAILREEFETRVRDAANRSAHRDALLDRAAFYLLWQGGLRVSEVEELRLEDLDLPGQRLVVRRGKGLKDRVVYLSESVVRVLKAFLNERGSADTDHVFTYRNLPVKKDLVRSRITAAGKRVGVHVHPHRLRHTCATQLLNAGCKVTSIQQFLGHKRLNSTMIYARVHDQTVAADYLDAMRKIETTIS